MRLPDGLPPWGMKLDRSMSLNLISRTQIISAHQTRLGIAIGFGLWVMMVSMARCLTELPTERFQW